MRYLVGDSIAIKVNNKNNCRQRTGYQQRSWEGEVLTQEYIYIYIYTGKKREPAKEKEKKKKKKEKENPKYWTDRSPYFGSFWPLWPSFYLVWNSCWHAYRAAVGTVHLNYTTCVINARDDMIGMIDSVLPRFFSWEPFRFSHWDRRQLLPFLAWLNHLIIYNRICWNDWTFEGRLKVDRVLSSFLSFSFF